MKTDRPVYLHAPSQHNHRVRQPTAYDDAPYTHLIHTVKSQNATNDFQPCLSKSEQTGLSDVFWEPIQNPPQQSHFHHRNIDHTTERIHRLASSFSSPRCTGCKRCADFVLRFSMRCAQRGIDCCLIPFHSAK